MRRLTLALAALVLGAVALRLWRRGSHPPLDVVRDLELGRYMGHWYEIGRLPSRFERACSQSQATYRQLDRDRVEVVNRCTTARGDREIRGIAHAVDPSVPARLRVAFGLLRRGDYQVLYVDDRYVHAVVGEPTRRFGWILSRRPTVDAETWRRLSDVLAAQGFDVDRLIRVDCTGDRAASPDPVTEAGLESFPASDPPSYAPGLV